MHRPRCLGKKKRKKEVGNGQKRSPRFLPEGLEKRTKKDKEKQWPRRPLKAI